MGRTMATTARLACAACFFDTWPGYTTAIMEAAKAEGFDYFDDMNASFEDGYFPVTISNIDDKRVSANVAYLTMEVRARPNLDILDRAEVQRLNFDGTRITGLNGPAAGGLRDTIRANEVIVSGGSTHSPAILMRSGVGPAAHCRHLGIDIVADRAGVGQHLMEHPGVSIASLHKAPGAAADWHAPTDDRLHALFVGR